MAEADKDDIFEQHTRRYARRMKIAVALAAVFLVYTIWFMVKQEL